MTISTDETTGGRGAKGTEAPPQDKEKNESKSINEKLTNENEKNI